jgi:hypothetical protein
LAAFKALELLRDQLGAVCGAEIQCALRDTLMPEQRSLPVDPLEPF